jgi:mannose-6-phosphate isomerase-like protein (cupin superfamily)
MRASIAFVLGVALGALLGVPPPMRRRPAAGRTSAQSSVAHRADLPETGVSHNPLVRKVVLAGYMELPHVTQIAYATLRPGQEASENAHDDMAELFYFLGGTGTVRLGKTNHSVRSGSVVKAMPPTPHTIWNTHDSEPLTLLSVASIL